MSFFRNHKKGFTPLEDSRIVKKANHRGSTEVSKIKKPPYPLTGFTLIEVIVYVAVFSIIMVAVLAFLFWALQLHAKTKAMQETLENAERAMNQMILEIRAADGLYTSTTSSTQLSLETRKYLPAGETSSYIDFFLCDQRLCFKRESQNPVALTSDDVDITNLQFTEVATATSTPSVHISLTAEYENPNNRPKLEASVTLNSAASLRSY